MSMQIVRTKQGPLSGLKMQGYTVFKGVPYARPPVGELRWRSPQPPLPWTGTFEAFHFSNRCHQMVQAPDTFYGKEFFMDPEYLPPMSEDCLYLNIWTPASSAGENLPVAMWIHGGAFINGFSTEMEFDGEAFCQRGVILVTINYRLGVFGFLAHPELSAENNGLSGNYGILDQLAALDWLRENIAVFGGDPQCITVFGQSAGGMSTQTLVSSPLAEGKIARAIIQSGGGYPSGLSQDRSLQEGEEAGKAFLAFCKKQSIADMRVVPAGELMELSGSYFASLMVNGAPGGLPFAPIQDGWVMPIGYNQAVEQASIHKIPYLLGCTKNDLTMDPESVADRTRSPLFKGCVGWCQKMEEIGAPLAYAYYFARQLLGDDAGAFHSSELWYVFGTLGRSWRPKEAGDYTLSDRMTYAWTNFMRTGNPNGDHEHFWQPCTRSDPFVMTFDVEPKTE